MRILPVALVFIAIGTAHCQKWSFVVAGDGRADMKKVRAEDKNGMNVVITKEIAAAVLKEKAKFLMWTGDLVSGFTKTPEEFETQLLAWRGVMAPLYKNHIPVLACRGNHDAGAAESWSVWDKVFSGPFAMPQNGPADERNLTYYFGKGDVLIIGLDQYKGTKETINQPWLDGVLARFHKPFVFAMGHEPAFMDGSHKDNMDADPAKRDAFWESLIKAGSRVFFAGHDHLYDHMAVTRTGAEPGPEMHQFVAGTAGAPFYPQGDYAGNNTNWTLRRVKHIDNTYGYILVEIDGKKATITFEGRTAPGKYIPMDSYSYVAR